MQFAPFNLVQTRELKITFTRFLKKEKNGDWSVSGYMVPNEATVMCVGSVVWLKPRSQIDKKLHYNHANQAEIEVTYPGISGKTKSFFIPLAIFSSFCETTTNIFTRTLFECYSI